MAIKFNQEACYQPHICSKAEVCIWDGACQRRDQSKPLIDDRDLFNLEGSINFSARICHYAALQGGWWHDPKTKEPLFGKRNVGEMLCLIHSEISEAMEGHRKRLKDDKLPEHDMLEVELCDAMIRILDLSRALGYVTIGHTLAKKIAYNLKREDHKPENRLKEGGKAY